MRCQCGRTAEPKSRLGMCRGCLVARRNAQNLKAKRRYYATRSQDPRWVEQHRKDSLAYYHATKAAKQRIRPRENANNIERRLARIDAGLRKGRWAA